MCYIMTADGFTMLSSEEAEKLYGLKNRSDKPLTKKNKQG